jgi:hypothetical protein
MKNFKACVLGILLAVFFITSSLAGVWTGNKFIYKPQEGARGASEKNSFDAGLDQIDARLGKEIWVGDPNYGATPQDAITAIGSTPAILRMAAGTYNIAADFTIPANITLKLERGAIFVIATGKTLTINGGFEAGLYQTFTCTGTGKVHFGFGAVSEVNAKWFGAKGDGVSDDLTALNLARQALPLYDGTSTGESGELCRRGTIYLPPGDYRVSDTFRFGLATIVRGEGQWKTYIGFQDNIATSSEKFVIAIDRYMDNGTTPMSFRTHGVHLKGVHVNGNKATNPYASGVQWYGAEMNGLSECCIENCALRGLVLGKDDQNGTTQATNTVLSRVLINNIDQGPGLQINCYHMHADDLAVTYVNAAGNKSGGDYIPGVRIVYSNDIFIGSLKTENCSGQTVLIENCPGITVADIFGFWTTADSSGDRTAVRITGTASYYINLLKVHAQNMTNLIKDDGWTGGTHRGKTILTAVQPYSQYITSAYGYDLQSETGTIGTLTVKTGTTLSGSSGMGAIVSNGGVSPTFASTFTGNDGPFIFGATQDSANRYERYLDLGAAAYSDSGGVNGGSAIRFWTANASAGSAGTRAPTERMRIERDGSVVIGATNANAKALLKLNSTTQGFLPPVMTTAQKNAISSPPEGLVVYDSNLHKLAVYNGSAWETVTSSAP